MFSHFAWKELQTLPIFEKLVQQKAIEEIQQHFDMNIPEQYIPVYVAAEEKYGVPWTLLAAHHRIETRFSTVKSMVSSAGQRAYAIHALYIRWLAASHMLRFRKRKHNEN